MKGSDYLQVQDILGKDLVGDESLTEEELRFLMSVTDEDELQLIYKNAYEVKAKSVKPVAYYRGLIEFSNRCIKNCNYCGIRRENDKTERFDMNREDIIKMAQWAYDHEYGSITLQSGERSDDIFVDYVVDLIRDIKAIGDGSLGITMCVGEQSEEAYRRMRAAFGWMTPQVNTQLHGPAQAVDPHAEHQGHHHGMEMPASTGDTVLFDEVLQAARGAGINAAKLEIRPPRDANSAWTVTEIDRGWPTQVDAVAVDGSDMHVIDKTRFDDFPLMAKLTRWGVDFHMGVLFGLPNQLVLIVFGLALCVMIVMGYRLWWLRRPAGASISPVQTLVQSWLALPVVGRTGVSIVALLLALALPVLGVSLLLFLSVDVLRWRKASALRHAGSPR